MAAPDQHAWLQQYSQRLEEMRARGEETLTRGVLHGGSLGFGDLTAVGKEAVKETHERFGEDDGGENQTQTPRGQ